MILFIIIVTGVYLISINVFGFTLLIAQKKQVEKQEEITVKDGKLLAISMLGGGVGVFSAILIFKHRLQSLLFMVIIPIIIAVTAYISYLAISYFINLMNIETQLLVFNIFN